MPMTQGEVYHLLKENLDTKMTVKEIRIALDDGKGWNVSYFCQRLHDHGCIQREQFGTRRAYRYWVTNGNKQKDE